MAIRRNFETLLIWIRASLDNLIYTAAIMNAFVAIIIMIYVDYKLGLVYGIGVILGFLLAIVWNS